MMKFIVSTICRETLQSSINIYNATDLEGNYLKDDIPTRINQSKTHTYANEFAGTLWFTTITRIS